MNATMTIPLPNTLFGKTHELKRELERRKSGSAPKYRITLADIQAARHEHDQEKNKQEQTAELHRVMYGNKEKSREKTDLNNKWQEYKKSSVKVKAMANRALKRRSK